MWFIVVTFLNATIPNSNMNEIFIFSNPSFEQQVDCNNYVQVMNMDIYAKAAASTNFDEISSSVVLILVSIFD